MSYFILPKEIDDQPYIYSNGVRSCIAEDKVFQRWLRDNETSLPEEIMALVEAGELTIEPAD